MRIRKPEWFKVQLFDADAFEVHRLMRELGLHTVCQEARCPNIGECFSRHTATFLILGDTCTRNCRFCAIKTGEPEPPDPAEPPRIAEAVKRMGLKYCVITGVNRDDLHLGGADYYAENIRQVKALNSGIRVEALPGDFSGSEEALKIVLEAEPYVFNHNIETVERLTPLIRDQRADYRTSLKMLRLAREHRPGIFTKSGMLIGLGETWEEILNAMKDLREADCGGVTIGQYIAPSREHNPVEKYYTPEEFKTLEIEAFKLGFKGVASGPLVRSSYRAADFFNNCV